MSKRIDSETMMCRAHDIDGCVLCVVYDFQDWVCARRERRERAKLEAKSVPVHERFDLGGEG